ncbi:MAG: reverse transcriptase N-terminal domain-containing protein [Candidatus Lokiarchaeota archaeon]|nr:reverse transcriptase N-terminal domain-containing protein [Candidatus Lokiarchaeota archaeon]
MKDYNWSKVKHNVDKLQKRIFRACTEKRWKTVRSLQNLFIHSLNVKLFAMYSFFFSNRNYKRKITAGVDGKLYESPKQLRELLKELNFKNYQPLPVKRVYIHKNNNEKRPIGIPTIKDRIMQKIILMALEAEWEVKLDSNTYGYRKNHSIHNAINQVKTDLQTIGRIKDKANNSIQFCWILTADISKFFENISHIELLKKIKNFKTLINKWLKVGYFYKGNYYKSAKGLSQGAVISPLLANIALDGIEQLFGIDNRKYIPFLTRTTNNGGISLIKYADDFIVIAPSYKILKNLVVPKLNLFLKKRGLNLNMKKTKIVRSNMGFEFLGFTFKQIKNNNQAFIQCIPSKRSIEKFFEHVREITLNIQLKDLECQNSLFHFVSGWLNYFRPKQCNMKRSFLKNQLNQLLKQSVSHTPSIQLTAPTSSRTSRCGWFSQLNKILQLT